MTYFVYLIESCKNKKLITYVGYTKNLEKRINLHNSGKGAKFTRGKNWKLIYYEIVKTKSKAMRREYVLKKDRKFRKLLKSKI